MSQHQNQSGGQVMMPPGPDPAHVAELRGLLDLLRDFPDNDQRARYLLTCNWMRDHGAEAARLAGMPFQARGGTGD